VAPAKRCGTPQEVRKREDGSLVNAHLRLAYNTFADHTCDDVTGLLNDVRSAGFTGASLYSAHARSLAAGGEANRTALSGLTAIGYFVEFLDVHNPEPERALAGAARVCRELGCPWLTVIPGPGWAGREEELRGLLRGLVREIGVLLEPLNPVMSSVTDLHEPQQALRLLDGLPLERAGWVLDTTHLTPAVIGSLPEDVVRRLVIVQLADLRVPGAHPDERVDPGCGVLPLAALVRGLRDAGFDGWWEAEVGQAAPDQPRSQRLTELYVSLTGLLAS
jgi:sugar phosphate isomerase/epimerase